MTVALAMLLAAASALPLQEAPLQKLPLPPPPPAAESESVSDVIERLASTDTLRALSPPAVLDDYRADPAFQYDRPEAEGPTLWERFWDWVARMFFEPIDENTSDQFWEWALLLVAVLALGWVAARLLRTGGVGVFVRGERQAGVAPGPLLDAEDIAEVDLGTRLRRALAAGDLREAVRVRYLLLLQALDAAGDIAWRRDKTNRQYVAEVAASDRARARPFRRATAAFDAVWYGERPVSAALFARLEPVFDRALPTGVSAPVPT